MIKKLTGYSISYKSKSPIGGTLLNHSLYGRISYKKSRGKKVGYYLPGMLHNIKFFRPENAKVFVENLDTIDTDMLKVFADITIEKGNYEVEESLFITGHKYWSSKAKSIGVVMKIKRGSLRKNV